MHDDDDDSEDEFDADGIIEGIERSGSRMRMHSRITNHDDDFEYGDEDEDESEDDDSDDEYDDHVVVRGASASQAAASSMVGKGIDLHRKNMSVTMNQAQGDSFGKKKSQVLYNQPFDEVLEASSDTDTESVHSSESERDGAVQQIVEPKEKMPNPGSMSSNVQQQQHRRNTTQDSDDKEESEDDSEDDENDESDEDGDLGRSAGRSIMEYDPNSEEIAKLRVPSEVKSLFSYISAYNAYNIELELRQKPFIPDYIPAVGDLDPFLKIPRPDNNKDFLGLKFLDEPNSMQSDPAVITLNLQYTSRATRAKPVEVVSSIENSEKNPKRIMKWVEDIKQLHLTKPPTTVNYSKPMPDINKLMQAWPSALEEMLSNVELPSAELDIELEDYVRIVCAMLDIPIHNDNLIQSLHMLFTLYVDFTTNQHFGAQINSL